MPGENTSVPWYAVLFYVYWQYKVINKICYDKIFRKNRRESTILRDNKVHEIHAELRAELGVLADVVSRQYIYERIKMRTGLCTKTIAFIFKPHH